MSHNDIWAQTPPPSLDEFAEPARRPALLDAKVMMVDDDPLMTDLIQTHLEDAGYVNFVVTNNPLDALELLRAEEPGVLLLDLMMPQLSGFDLLKAIRADKALRFTPVIVLTAASGADAKLRALQLGATDFLSKPVDPSELALRVRNTLAYQQYHKRQVDFDAATGLPKTRLFDRGVRQLMARYDPANGLAAVLIIVLPELRLLRQSLSERAVDDIVNVQARRLESFANQRPDGADLNLGEDRPPHLARLGPDEFCLLLEGLPDVDTVEAQVKAVIHALAVPVKVDQHEITVKTGLGIALFPGDADSSEGLRQSAMLAAAHACQLEHSHYEFASEELNAKSLQKLTLGTELRGAAERGELCLHYQPKVSLRSGQIIGVEALVRWQHPTKGLLPPAMFVPLAEEIGLITLIGDWVIEQGCKDAAIWAAAGFGEVKLAVNVAKPQFMAGVLVDTLSKALRRSGLAADSLVVELTESMLMDDVQSALAQMHDLKALGVTLSIDDFGTGYSSLAYLKRFPLNELKIDRSFVMDLPGQGADLAIVRAVIELGHNLGMSVIAEGVETLEQRQCLAELGCDSFQGYWFSRPLPLAALMSLLTNQAPTA